MAEDRVFQFVSAGASDLAESLVQHGPPSVESGTRIVFLSDMGCQVKRQWFFVISASALTPELAWSPQFDEREFENELVGLLEADWVENGVPHSAEALLKSVLPLASGLEWIHKVYRRALAETDWNICAGILRCLGRIPAATAKSCAMPLVTEALSFENIVIREAAIRALEKWGDREAKELLQNHAEAESSPWLKQYARRVARSIR